MFGNSESISYEILDNMPSKKNINKCKSKPEIAVRSQELLVSMIRNADHYKIGLVLY